MQARHLKQWVLGEDSGLSVDALGGEPGVYSARFSDPGATDERNNALLLEKLTDVPLEKRTAHYTCYAVLSDPDGNVRAESEGICRGRILIEPAGSGGFWLRSAVRNRRVPPHLRRAAPAVKRVLSHRSRAIRQLVPRRFSPLITNGDWPVE